METRQFTYGQHLVTYSAAGLSCSCEAECWAYRQVVEVLAREDLKRAAIKRACLPTLAEMRREAWAYVDAYRKREGLL